MNKEELMLRKRLADLSNRAYQRDIVTFSDFLNLNELHILHTTPKDMFPARYASFGGYDLSERQMIAFLPDALYYTQEEAYLPPKDKSAGDAGLPPKDESAGDAGLPSGYSASKGSGRSSTGREATAFRLPPGYRYPIQAVVISPLNKKFAEELSHRDYLGSVMNLGVERSKFGDIIVMDKEAVVFLCEEIADYVTDNLTRIRHTAVQCTRRELADISYTPSYTELKGTVPSVRLDTVMSVAFPMSRSKLTAYITAGKVFVNGKLITSNGFRLEEGNLISVRGLGRISYEGILSETKKGRYYISVRKYI